MKFILCVEGATEKDAIKKFLQNWLNARLKTPVGIRLDDLGGSGNYVHAIPKKARLYLKISRGDVIAVIGLLDLHNVALKIPGTHKTVEAKVRWASGHLEKQVGQAQFRQFFAVHETEAWLLSDSTIFPPGVKMPDFARPEAVNSDEPPHDLLERLYRTGLKRGYKKTTDGANLFRELNPDAAYAKCPNLKAMLDEMLRLAQQAGLA